MGRFLAIAALVLLAFVCAMLVYRLIGRDTGTRDQQFAQEQYVKYVRKAQRAARKNRAEADLYASLAESYKRRALGEDGGREQDEQRE